MPHHKYADEDQTCCGYADIRPTDHLTMKQIRRICDDHGTNDEEYHVDTAQAGKNPKLARNLNNWLGY